MKAISGPPCSDAAVKKKTGPDWGEWCRILDAEGALALAHRDLAEIIDRKPARRH
jgi:hypothetical protein